MSGLIVKKIIHTLIGLSQHNAILFLQIDQAYRNDFFVCRIDLSSTTKSVTSLVLRVDDNAVEGSPIFSPFAVNTSAPFTKRMVCLLDCCSARNCRTAKLFRYRSRRRALRLRSPFGFDTCMNCQAIHVRCKCTVEKNTLRQWRKAATVSASLDLLNQRLSPLSAKRPAMT